MQTTYDIADKGKAIPAQFLGKQVPVDLPDPHAADPIAEAMASGRFENAAALVSAAIRSLRIFMREPLVDAANKEGATLESIAEALKGVKFPAPRVSDPNAPKRERKGTGITKEAREALEREKGRYSKLEQWISAGDERKVKQAVAVEMFTQEEVDAARARLAGGQQ